MADIVISGDSSGSVTLRAPSVSGTTVLTLPTTSGTILTTAGGAAGSFTTLTASGAFSANGGATLGDASGDALTINSSAVSIPNGLNFDSNTLVIDATNNRVGIGTASPSQRLHVANAGSLGALVENTSGTGASYVQVKNTAGSSYLGQDSTGGYLLTDYSAPFLFYTNNTERMRIDSSGNVGIGTSSPNGKFNVVNQGANSIRFSSYGSATGSQIIGESAAGTIASPTATVDGNNLIRILGVGYTGTEFSGSRAEITITASQNWSTTANGTLIRFNTTQNDTTSSTERMRIDSSGNVQIGLSGTGDKTLSVTTNTSGSPYLSLSCAGADSGSLWFDRATLRLYARASNTGGVYLASGGTSWTSASDERNKDIIEPITDAITKLGTLRTVIGKYKTDKEDARRPFLIAQDVQAVFPEAVDLQNPDDLGIAYGDMIPLLVKAIQEQQAIINDLKARIETLETK